MTKFHINGTKTGRISYNKGPVVWGHGHVVVYPNEKARYHIANDEHCKCARCDEERRKDFEELYA